MSGRESRLIIAHRGDKVLAPENTIAAARLALRQGATGLEVDVRTCGSGEVVLMHDMILNRHFGVRRLVGNTSLAELRAQQFSARLYPYLDRVATLDEFFEEFRHTVPINLDAKSMTPANQAFARQLVRIIESHGVQDQVWISSFNPFLLRSLKRLRSGIRTGYLFQDPLNFYRLIDVFLESDDWHPHFKNVSEWFVDKARRLQKGLYVWTVNDRDVWERLKDVDIDGVITDVFFRRRPLEVGGAERER